MQRAWPQHRLGAALNNQLVLESHSTVVDHSQRISTMPWLAKVLASIA
eukprot:COSAG02_NODE_36362_length_455_cov_1.202247_1_plen_47_part_10